MRGNSFSRHNLGLNEAKAGNFDKARKHWLISCGCGQVESLEAIKTIFINGCASEEDYEKALKSLEEYIEDIKSEQRDEAAAYDQQYRYYLPVQNC